MDRIQDQFPEDFYWDIHSRVSDSVYNRLSYVVKNIDQAVPLKINVRIPLPFDSAMQLMPEGVRSGLREFREDFQACPLEDPEGQFSHLFEF